MPVLEAELTGQEMLERALGVVVPEEWPPELFDEAAVRFALERFRENPGWLDWGFRYFVFRDPSGGPGVLAGAGGYKGPPDEDGSVEISYSVLREFRRRGIATEATRGMVDRAFADDRVRLVFAQTLPELIPSIGVLIKTGFVFAGPGNEDGVIRYELARGRP
jgi:RimJ/RimL family protein N-acetyltransferase